MHAAEKSGDNERYSRIEFKLEKTDEHLKDSAYESNKGKKKTIKIKKV